MDMASYDIAIIGAGPAGLSAALTAQARNKQVLLVSNQASVSPLAKAQRIDNYPGLPGTSGLELLETMTKQAETAGALLQLGRVISVLPLEPGFMLSIGSEVVAARSVILAIGTGSESALPGEEQYLGKGVSYCATCDGMLFRGKRVVVYGLNDEAVGEANFLAEIGCDVVFISPKPTHGLSKTVAAYIGKITSIDGDGSAVTGVTTKIESLPSTECQAVFLLRPAIAPAALINSLELEDAGTSIRVDRNMATSIKGVFAAGDCVGKPHQIAKAVGEGLIAALSAVDFLSSS